MLFASVSLAARIERAECRMLLACARALAARRGDVDVIVRELAGGVATFTTPGSPLNKLAGLGFDGPLPLEALEALERTFAERGAPLQAEVSSLADPAITALLTRRGYVLQNFENVLARPLPLPDVAAPIPDVAVRLASDDEASPWLDILVSGFASPDDQGVTSHESFPREVLEDAVSDLAAGEGFVRYLARREGVLAGAAGMRVDGDIVQLCGAATLVAHRRRGVQTALLETRLADAGRAGCDLAIVVTQPGSKSCENVQRQGFELLYARAVLVRDP